MRISLRFGAVIAERKLPLSSAFKRARRPELPHDHLWDVADVRRPRRRVKHLALITLACRPVSTGHMDRDDGYAPVNPRASARCLRRLTLLLLMRPLPLVVSSLQLA